MIRLRRCVTPMSRSSCLDLDYHPGGSLGWTTTQTSGGPSLSGADHSQLRQCQTCYYFCFSRSVNEWSMWWNTINGLAVAGLPISPGSGVTLVRGPQGQNCINKKFYAPYDKISQVYESTFIGLHLVPTSEVRYDWRFKFDQQSDVKSRQFG